MKRVFFACLGIFFAVIFLFFPSKENCNNSSLIPATSAKEGQYVYSVASSDVEGIDLIFF